jgi:hypothetical protein
MGQLNPQTLWQLTKGLTPRATDITNSVPSETAPTTLDPGTTATTPNNSAEMESAATTTASNSVPMESAATTTAIGVLIESAT